MNGQSFGFMSIAGLMIIACLVCSVICLLRKKPRGKTNRISLSICAVLFAGFVSLLLLPAHTPKGRSAVNDAYDEHDAILASEWSELVAGEYASYPSFRSAVSGMLGHAALAARRCGVQGRYVQNLVATELGSEWLSSEEIDGIRRTVLSRDGSRWILANNTPPKSLPKQYLDVAFDVRGERDQGSIQIKVEAKEDGDSVKGNRAMPLTVLAKYTNQPWVEEAGSTDLDKESYVIGRSQTFSRLEEARRHALMNARRRFIESAFAAVEATRPEFASARATEIRAAAGSYLDDHPELKNDEFTQQTRGQPDKKFRVAVLMDFPRDSVLGALSLPAEARASSWRKQVLGAIGLAVLLMLSFLFLDVGRRGRYAWPLRFGTAIVFASLCVLLWKIGPLM